MIPITNNRLSINQKITEMIFRQFRLGAVFSIIRENTRDRSRKPEVAWLIQEIKIYYCPEFELDPLRDIEYNMLKLYRPSAILHRQWRFATAMLHRFFELV